jgi:hypothetical protein
MRHAAVLRTRAWPYFALAFMLGCGGVILGGVAGGLLAFASMLTFISACFRKLHASVHDLPEMERTARRINIIN